MSKVETYEEYAKKKDLDNKPYIEYEYKGSKIKMVFLGEVELEEIYEDSITRQLNEFVSNVTV